MGKADIWPTVHAERQALAADLRTLGQDQWDTESLCASWSTRDVLAHMTAAALMTPPGFFAKLAASGFSFNGVQEKGIAAHKGASPADTLAHFNAALTSVKHPPGPADTMLGETIIHAEDIRRPLGISHDYPTQAVVQAADFFKGSNLLIGAKNRIAGLRLRATDTEWSCGDGPEVAGPILSLVMAMTGRKAPVDDLTGDGVATLRSRS
jgi:uncharacterized protein (TIGR03083 family)